MSAKAEFPIGGLFQLICLLVALCSSTPRSVGAAICFAILVWDEHQTPEERD